ncbi:unnamed protein product, partial [Ectocarpus sp. 8 AP-2014]
EPRRRQDLEQHGEERQGCVPAIGIYHCALHAVRRLPRDAQLRPEAGGVGHPLSVHKDPCPAAGKLGCTGVSLYPMMFHAVVGMIGGPREDFEAPFGWCFVLAPTAVSTEFPQGV